MIASAAAREHLFTFEEYVRIAEHSPTRLEFWDGVILDMAGGTPRHSAICNNIGHIVGGQLRGRPCRAYDANLNVRSSVVNRATFADATIVCGALQLDPTDRTGQTVLNPSLLIEVHSPSTEADDCGPKLDCYKTIASVKAVVLVSQDERRIAVHEHQPDGRWSETVHVDGMVELRAIGCTLPLDEAYEDLPE
ncbi:MAG TPA: Uma2 family endonuclease [Vicinamibacterales bacterium]|nr:Uma2 family endonuclease [Vicinamibacterales bacterium]